MKSITILASFALCFFMFSSCRDKCKDVVCLNGGTCADGDCICPEPWGGADCSINTDPCHDVNCLNGGSCTNGACVCPHGYEGVDCGTSSVTKFVGIYSGKEQCSTGSYEYTVQMAPSATNITNLLIDNLYESNMVITATLDQGSTMSFSIPDTTLNSITIQGTGSINSTGTTVTINYTVNNGMQTDICVATLTRQ